MQGTPAPPAGQYDAAAHALRNQLQGYGGSAPPLVPSLDMLNFLEQAAASPSPNGVAAAKAGYLQAPAPTTSKAPSKAPPAFPAPPAPAASSEPASSDATAGAASGGNSAAATAAPAASAAAPWRANAPWHRPAAKQTTGVKPTTFSKASQPKAPQPATSPGQPGSSNPEELAQVLSNHLQNPSGTLSVEHIQALARAAQLEDEGEAPAGGAEAAETTEAAAQQPEPSGSASEEPAVASTSEAQADAAAASQSQSQSEAASAAAEPAASPREADAAAASQLPKLPAPALEQLSRDALAAARQAATGGRPGGGAAAAAAEAAATAAVELMTKQLRIASAGETGSSLSEDAGVTERGTPEAGADKRPAMVEALPAPARVAAGPTKAIYRYDFSSATEEDVEAVFRNIRRRIEVEMGDGCSVQMSLQMVR